MKKQLTFLLFCLCALALPGQTTFTLERSLQWAAAPTERSLPNGKMLEQWTFTGSTFDALAPALPVFSERFALTGRSKITVEIVAVQYETFAKKPSSDDAALSSELQLESGVSQERQRYWGWVRFVPVRRAGSGFERVTSFTVQVRVAPEPAAPVSGRGGPHTFTSALSSGSIYKFGVSQNNLYKLDYNFLKNELGINNLDNIDPHTIRVFGNGGKMLPEKNSDPRPDDLIENAILVVGEQDGKFDANDYVLFYAVGPDPWIYRASNSDPELTVRKNLYDRYGWYFIKIGDGAGLRVPEQPSLPASFVTEEFDEYQRIEDEKVNLLDFAESAQGSGKRWYGEYFYQTREREYKFEIPNIVGGSSGRIRAEFAGRSEVGSTVRFVSDGLNLARNISGVDVDGTESNFAALTVLQSTFQPASDKFTVKVQYPNVSRQSEGWLDYIEINVRRRLAMSGQVMEFRDLKTLTQDATTFRISGVNGGLTVWDITDPQSPVHQLANQNGGTVEFGAATKDLLRNFIAFYDNAGFIKPQIAVGKTNNQNLHGLQNLHMAIVYHPDFEAQANELANHRKQFSGLEVSLVNVNQLYNEFSSGAKDPTAIRDFAGMLLERNPDKFEYLLLFGDGSFDPKNNTGSEDNKDFIPVFETSESFNPITAYPSDDYFALLSEDEGGNHNLGSLDIAVGRITARSPGEAQAVVSKIIAYDSKRETLGDWHLRNLFIADDEDGNPHIRQAEILSDEVNDNQPFFNLDKVYFDAYQQIATSAGDRFPDAKAAINANVFKGALIIQYIGHGGPRGWAQERVIDNNDIAGWENPDRYPLIITATCSFGGYDDYKTLTGGEQSLIKIKSGAIALFTTVRAVYISDNERLTSAVQDVIFKKVNGRYRSIGDILKDAKNTITPSTFDNNARRFTLLGDPAMYLAMPEHQVVTTRINGHDLVVGQPDTLKALMPAEIEGMVTDSLGTLLDNFNGKVYVTVFDKAQNLQTLGQDPGSIVRSFSVQRNTLFKGSATVSKGTFKIQFIVPKDINYAYGFGKISYYAENGTPLDAAGSDKSIVVGGNANQIKDDQPPLVQAFLNTDGFALGGITDNDPKILIKCSDDYGMNVSGTSLGHDLTAVLDDNVLETIVLNDFYQSEQDNYRKGQAIYPLRNIATGRHKLRVKGWDIANNPGEGYTEFVVAEDGKAALDHVLNYPNPFTTNTYFQFGHNMAGQLLDVQVSIFSVSGKLVKTILHSAPSEGYRVADIQWNGRDEYGDPLARGVYLYRVKVRGTDLNGASITTESDFEKLVILK